MFNFVSGDRVMVDVWGMKCYLNCACLWFLLFSITSIFVPFKLPCTKASY